MLGGGGSIGDAKEDDYKKTCPHPHFYRNPPKNYTPMTHYPCARCHQTKPANAFHKKSQREAARRLSVVYPYCKPCRAFLDADRRQRHRQIIWDEKTRRGGCQDCGKTYHPYVMDFDHRPGEQKRFEISEGGSRTHTLLFAELAKCDLVCANCHRLRTWQRTRESPPL